MAEDTIRYDVVLVEGTEYVCGKVKDRRSKLTLTECKNLSEAPEGHKWITVGWSNPLAPTGWKDE